MKDGRISEKNHIILFLVKRHSERVKMVNHFLRKYLIYQFTLINEKLFLTGAYYYEYEKGEKIGHTIFSFKDDGKMLCEKKNYKSNEIEEREGIVDVSVNWEDIPEFGDYESIIRTER